MLKYLSVLAAKRSDIINQGCSPWYEYPESPSTEGAQYLYNFTLSGLNIVACLLPMGFTHGCHNKVLSGPQRGGFKKKPCFGSVGIIALNQIIIYSE